MGYDTMGQRPGNGCRKNSRAMKGQVMEKSIRGSQVRAKLLLLVFGALLVTLWLEPNGVMAETGLAIKEVRIDRTRLGPGEQVFISFLLTEGARVSLHVYDPDYTVVRRLLDGQQRPAGTNTLAWDGRDDTGDFVPDEAYLFTILAENDKGVKAKYDPTAYSGGERLDMKMDRVERSAGYYTLYYSVPEPARITIRAGIHQGPLLKTIVDWKAMPPGEYTATWDGLDETGQIRVMDEANSILYITGFSLPDNAIIVEGSGVDYNAYKEETARTAASGAESLTLATVRSAALERKDKDISPRYLARRAFNEAPRFKVSLAKGVSNQLMQATSTAESETVGLADVPTADVSGEVKLKIEVAPESMRGFNEYRHEIVVFLDNERFDEEESAYTPYTYSLNTRALANGEHSITINLVNLSGPIGSYSFRINVSN